MVSGLRICIGKVTCGIPVQMGSEESQYHKNQEGHCFLLFLEGTQLSGNETSGRKEIRG